MIQCLIIDDEPKARNLLKAIIEEYCPQLTIVAFSEDLPTAVKAIKKHQPQLIFLDIEMPGYSGLDILDFFNDDEVNFSIIFTTAYNEYAIHAFKLSAIDYLLKPIQHTQLIDAVERFLKRQLQHTSIETLKVLQQNVHPKIQLEDKRIAIPTVHSIKFIRPAEIVLIKAEAAYSELFLVDGTKVFASKNLKHFEEALEPFV
ncbi:MAG: LytR/AlgR family response regulator transcription factor, partial [Chitinophagaceae bacterium]